MHVDGNRLRVRVLGPIRVVDGAGRDLTPDGALQRRLLALLVLRRGRVVTPDSAIDALWPSEPPRDPLAALQNHLFRLRRRLPDDVIESVGDGYRLDPAAIELDVDDASAALFDEAASVEALDAVLAGWSGQALPELVDVDEGLVEASRLDDLRLALRERRAELRIDGGDPDGSIADLQALVSEEPLRERPRALMMSALAATGRRVEALRVYDEFRRLLSDDLGIEPSPVLAAQHAELLAGTGSAFASSTSLAPAARLPVAATSLVGRDELADELATLAGDHRVVTLVGPGGVGKTRLLIELGHRLRHIEPDRAVVFCELSPVDDDSAIDAVAATLGIDRRPGVPLSRRIADVLTSSSLVLLLDNCEHVLGPAAELVAGIVTTCPDVTVVATSRERLRVPGEQVRPVPTLPTVADDDAGTSAAVQLFVERGRAVVHDFDPTDDQLAVVCDIVQRLDGLPLAIELAAARLHTHDLADIATGLDRRFSLLTTGNRTSARHASLGAAVSWSYDALDPALQDTLADLSVFAGAFDVAAAAAVRGTDAVTVTDALGELVERSLVTKLPGRRYTLLETLRAFGAEQLVASGRQRDVGERHARHQLQWVIDADRRLLEPDNRALDDIARAVPELRTALAWLLDHDEIELAGGLVRRVQDFGFLGVRPDVLAWSQRVIAADPDDRSPLAAAMWVINGYAIWMFGDVTGAGECSDRSLLVAERAGQPVNAEMASLRGSFFLFDGQLAESAEWFHRGVEAASDDPAQRWLAGGAEVIARGYAMEPEALALADALLAEVGEQRTPYAAYLWYCAGEAYTPIDEARAREQYEVAVELAELSHARFVFGVALASKASIDARSGDPLTAAADYRRLLDHWRRAGMWSSQWTLLRSVAVLLDRLGRHRDAAILEGAVRATTVGHRLFGADEVALAELGMRVRSAMGDDSYHAAVRDGAMLDGNAAVEHALAALV